VTGHLGLGSNLGDRRARLQAAVDALAARGVAVEASSSVYETAPVGAVLDQPAFLNACVRIATSLEPEALLDAAKAVERELGRRLRDAPRHGPREIDVDLLLLGSREHASARLRVPHAELERRRFVLVGLLELDFELRTPGGTRLADVLAALPVDGGVRRHGPPLATTARAPRRASRRAAPPAASSPPSDRGSAARGSLRGGPR
jgi:2-amino-4-hydroxy-6-hydroxymethyldihydropteridine diphosphokinase